MTSPTALLHLTGADPEAHHIPAEILVRTLEGVQQAIFVLAAMSENRMVAKRFKPDAKFRQRYQLTCKIPQAGSYSLPVTLLAPQQETVLMPSPDAESLLDLFCTGIGAIASSTLENLHSVIPDANWRDRFLRIVRASMIPKAGERWKFGFRRNALDSSSEVLLTSTHTKILHSWVEAHRDKDEREIPIIGQLKKIDFAKNCLTIGYPIGDTSRDIECVYDQELEPMLIAQRRDWVQVIGKCTVDEHDIPKEITDVTSIEAVDLSDMIFDSFENGTRTLTVTSDPLIFSLNLDSETQQLLTVEEPALDINAFAYTRDALAEEITAQVFFLWDEYGQEDDSRLTDDAKNLARAVRERFEESSNASP